MVISRKHKYCFIEYPRSASYAIRKELLELYDGEDWLNKHSPYRGFARSLPNEHQDYFVFCSIRNPLADLVSIYNVNRTNNSGRAEPEFWRKYKWYVRYYELRRAKFFHNESDTSFAAFFRKFFRLPYIKPRIVAELKSGVIDDVIRVENIQQDFERVLGRLNIKVQRQISNVNVSTREAIDYNVVYPPALRPQAVRVLGPMMQFMGYDFPPEWGVHRIPVSSRVYFNAVKPLAAAFWNHVNYVNK